jgi:shikimate kinase
VAGDSAAERLEALLAERRDAYAGSADAVIDTAGRTPDAVARAIAELWMARGGGAWAPSGS